MEVLSNSHFDIQLALRAIYLWGSLRQIRSCPEFCVIICQHPEFAVPKFVLRRRCGTLENGDERQILSHYLSTNTLDRDSGWSSQGQAEGLTEALEMQLQLQYAMAIIRLVNGIADSAQKKKVASSVAALATNAGALRP